MTDAITYSVYVSIHALLAECDNLKKILYSNFREFQSTHSLRSATESREELEPEEQVSIHALLAECDL